MNPENKLVQMMLARLELDPNQISAEGFTVEMDNSKHVVIRWSGVVYMPVEEYSELVADALQ